MRNELLNILEAVKCIIPHSKVLLVGSSEEYAHSLEALSEESPIKASNPYGISKSTQEQFAKMYAKRHDLKIYKVRAFNHTGVGQSESFVIPSWCKQVAAISKSGISGVINVGNLEISRDFSDVRDIVRAYRLVLESDLDDITFNVGSGIAYHLKDLIQLIVSFSETPIKIEVDQSLIRSTDNPMTLCDYSLIREKLGWEPIHNLHDTIKEMFLSYLTERQ